MSNEKLIKSLSLRAIAVEEARLAARAERLRERIAALKAELSDTNASIESLRDKRANDVRELFFKHRVKQIHIAANAGKRQGYIANLISRNTRCRLKSY